jgi:hypothetical protein
MSTTKILLASNIDESSSHREYLLSIMQRAGMDVIDMNDTNQDVKTAFDSANASIHILSRDYGKTIIGNSTVSVSKHQLNEAKLQLAANPDTYKIFIWYPPDVLAAEKEPQQEEFINEIRNSISKGMIFTTIGSPIQLVDDVRSMIATETKQTFDIKEAEVFLVFNQLDEGEADGIIDMLSDIVDVSKLNIIQDSDMDYSEFCSQQISKSKLAVVYFKETADWALPFTQQVWKKVGGASSHTPILLIGDEDPDINMNKKFNAPKIISLIVSGDLIPLEIKVQYDKVIGN